MSRYAPSHAMRREIRNPLMICAKRYVRLHKRYHILFILGMCSFDVLLIVLHVEALLHFVAISGTTVWETAVALAESE